MRPGKGRRGGLLPVVDRTQQTVELGAKIRALRAASGLTAHALAGAVGLSRSAISQIEGGRTEPSLRTLRRLALALDIPLPRLFETRPSDSNPIIRKHERKVFYLHGNRLRYELLSPDLVNKRVEFLRFELEPDPSDPPQLYAHEGEQYGVLIRGRVELRIQDGTYILRAGDSVFFDGTAPHYVRNVGRTKAVMIWAISPPSRPLSLD
jgi:transcriptional regulator with XRE-family HTH domain